MLLDTPIKSMLCQGHVTLCSVNQEAQNHLHLTSMMQMQIHCKLSKNSGIHFNTALSYFHYIHINQPYGDPYISPSIFFSSILNTHNKVCHKLFQHYHKQTVAAPTINPIFNQVQFVRNLHHCNITAAATFSLTRTISQTDELMTLSELYIWQHL